MFLLDLRKEQKNFEMEWRSGEIPLINLDLSYSYKNMIWISLQRPL